MEQNRLDVLKKVELGEISLEDAAERLAEFEENKIEIKEQPEVIINSPMS